MRRGRFTVHARLAVVVIMETHGNGFHSLEDDADHLCQRCVRRCLIDDAFARQVDVVHGSDGL
jgi:hypothetical protein